MTGVLDGLVCAALIVGGTLGARWAGWRWHGWHLRRVHAQHAPRAAVPAWDPYEQWLPPTPRYDDLALPGRCGIDSADPKCAGCPYWPICGRAADEFWNDPESRPADWREQVEAATMPAFLPAAPDWREQTMAELGALADPGPGVVAPSGPLPGPVTISESDWMAPPVAKPWPAEKGASVGRGLASTDATAPASAPTRLAHTGDIYGARLDLGPRAAAVLERYERRRRERWALA